MMLYPEFDWRGGPAIYVFTEPNPDKEYPPPRGHMDQRVMVGYLSKVSPRAQQGTMDLDMGWAVWFRPRAIMPSYAYGYPEEFCVGVFPTIESGLTELGHLMGSPMFFGLGAPIDVWDSPPGATSAATASPTASAPPVTTAMAETATALDLVGTYWCATLGHPVETGGNACDLNGIGCPYHPPMEPIRRWFAGIDREPPSDEEKPHGD